MRFPLKVNARTAASQAGYLTLGGEGTPVRPLHVPHCVSRRPNPPVESLPSKQASQRTLQGGRVSQDCGPTIMFPFSKHHRTRLAAPGPPHRRRDRGPGERHGKDAALWTFCPEFSTKYAAFTAELLVWANCTGSFLGPPQSDRF